MRFKTNRPKFEHLKQKWTKRQKTLETNFWDAHGDSLRQLAVGSLGGLLLLSPPHNQIPANNLIVSKDDVLKGYDKNVLLAQQLADDMPKEVRSLDENEEKNIIEVLSRNFGFKVTTELNGIRLNRNYGFIGGEQHLYRYPGDNLYAHADNSIDWAKYSGSGIAPGLGAWGYFAHSKESFTEQDKIKERYYLSIQTFLSPFFA